MYINFLESFQSYYIRVLNRTSRHTNHRQLFFYNGTITAQGKVENLAERIFPKLIDWQAAFRLSKRISPQNCVTQAPQETLFFSLVGAFPFFPSNFFASLRPRRRSISINHRHNEEFFFFRPETPLSFSKWTFHPGRMLVSLRSPVNHSRNAF